MTVAFIGAYFHWVAVGIGAAMIIGRAIYTIGYKAGAHKRTAGAIITDLAILVAIIMSIVTCVMLVIQLYK